MMTTMRETQQEHTCGSGRNVAFWRIFSVLLMCLYTVAECAEPDCGQTNLQRPSGNITSPNYPRNYPANTACKWHIPLAVTEILTIRFISFSIAETKGCHFGDKLTITVGQDDVIYCGSSLPTPYISKPQSPEVIIKFTSDNTISSSGFMLEYFKGERHASSCSQNEFHCAAGNCVPQWWVCDDKDECGDNSDEASCINVHTTPAMQCPSHTFLCHRVPDSVQVCLPESLKCDGHRDCVNNEDEASCQSVCSHFLKGLHGSFESPNFPEGYDPNLDCFWVLTVDEGAILQLRFYEFDLEKKYNTDYVKVYDGPEETDHLIGTYYGAKDAHNNKGIYMPPTVIEGTGNQLRVSLVTDSKVSASGFNATFQVRGHCLPGQTLCGPGDSNCYDDKLEHCDNRLTCLRGQDELNCRSSCPGNGKDLIPCFRSSKGCFTQEQRCNGKRECAAGEDEKDCDATLCNSRVGLFRCSDGTCMEERFICNSANDCQHGEDEENCYASTNVVTAAAVGSIVCGLLLVAALSCTCKLYQLHVRERLPPSHMSPLREIEEELLRREAPPSYTATMASPHFDEAQRAFIEGIQAAVIARNESRGPSRSSGRRQRSTFVRMLSRDRPRSDSSGGGQQQLEPEDSTTPSQSETLPPSPDAESPTPPEEITAGDNMPPPLRRISGDLSCPTVSPSLAEAIPQSGGEQEQESTSSSVSDTDSETNQEALHLAARDQQILRAAANIRRMRLAGGLQNVLQAQDHRAARVRSRTGSLVDGSTTNSDQEEYPGTSTSERDPELVAEVGSHKNTNNRTDTTDEGLTLQTPQDTTDESPEPSTAQDEAAHAENGSSPSHGGAQPLLADATCDDRVDPKEEEAVDKNSNEEILSQASSILSLQSCSSDNTDVPLLSP